MMAKQVGPAFAKPFIYHGLPKADSVIGSKGAYSIRALKDAGYMDASFFCSSTIENR
jgi:hypothetical protein